MRRLLIAATAGLVVGGVAGAQTEKSPSNQPRFVPSGTLLDAKVVARSEEKDTGEIDDLVVDTRTGTIAYAIIDTNGMLGTDNKTVAVPYGALSWDANNDRFVFDATGEQLRNLPVWDSKDLSRLRDTSWLGKLKGVFGDRSELQGLENDYAYHGDEYTMCFKHGHPQTIEGKVVSIDKKSMTAQGCPCTAIVIEGSDQARHTILLAPATYLSSKSAVPAEGSTVTIGTIEAFDGKGNPVQVAQWIKIDGNTVQVRNEKGVPAWHSDAQLMRPFYILASDMDDGKLYTEGKAFGSVKDIVFDAQSGTTAFAVISAGGILGIDDTLYPVPWRAVRFGEDDNLLVSMPASKLKLAPKLSEDGVKDLNNATFSKQVCAYYGLEPERYDTDRSDRWTNHRQASAE